MNFQPWSQSPMRNNSPRLRPLLLTACYRGSECDTWILPTTSFLLMDRYGHNINFSKAKNPSCRKCANAVDFCYVGARSLICENWEVTERLRASLTHFNVHLRLLCNHLQIELNQNKLVYVYKIKSKCGN